MCRLLCVLTVVCGGLLMGVAPALAAFPGENGRIAFDSDRDGGDFDVWTMSRDGRNLVNLTADSGGYDGRSNWRADGRKLVFMSDRETATNVKPPNAERPDLEIFVMNEDGSHVKQITDNAYDDEAPAWSPNAKEIVFQRDFDSVIGQADYDIFTMRADGTRQRNLTHSPGVQDYDPDWSPDGGRLAIVSERDGDAEIYTLKTDGSRVRQLTSNDAPFAFDGDPNWSPDSRKIAFTSERDATEETPYQVEIYTMRADGGKQTRLTFDDLSDFLPAWSPDGRKIAFNSFRESTPENPDNAEIYTMRADGSRLGNLTQTAGGLNFAPDWQPLDDHHGHDHPRDDD